MKQDLGFITSIDIVSGRIPLSGRKLIDIGCGDMTFSRTLVDAGAHVLAIDPDADQAERNRRADPLPHLEFIEAGAEAIPLPDRSVDGVYFSFSLHHVPATVYPEMFAEVFRILKPDGHLCVIEPTNCPLNEVMKFFHNEDVVRAEAQRALIQYAVPAFETHSVFQYHSYTEFDSYEQFAVRYGGRSFNTDYTEADVRRPEVEEAFERAGAPEYRFVSPKEMMLLQRLKLS